MPAGALELELPAEIEAELLARPRQRFIIPGFLPAGPCLLYGSSGAGKTGAAIHMAVAVAAGQSWAGVSIESGGVLYVAAEDRPGVRERVVAAIRASGMEPGDVKSLAVTSPPCGGLVSASFAEDIIIAAGELEKAAGSIRLVIIDTLASSFGDDSQDDARSASRAMDSLEKIARSLGCAALAVHHTGKSRQDMRGSQVFEDRADAVILAKRQGASTVLSLDKLRNGRSEQRFSYEIGSFELPVYGGITSSTQVVRNLRAAAPASMPATDRGREQDRRPRDRDVLLNLVHQMADAEGRVPRKGLKAACYAAWANKTNDGARNQAFNKSLTMLAEESLVQADRKFVSVSVSKKSAYKKAYEPETVSESVSLPPLKGAGAYLRTGGSPGVGRAK